MKITKETICPIDQHICRRPTCGDRLDRKSPDCVEAAGLLAAMVIPLTS